MLSIAVESGTINDQERIVHNAIIGVFAKLGPCYRPAVTIVST